MIAQLPSHVTLLRRIVGSGWSAGAKALCTAAISLVYSTAEHCVPVSYRSAHDHLIDSVLTDALCIVIGCLRPTPTDHLRVLSGMQPAELCRLGATLFLVHRRSLDPDHIFCGLLNGSSDARSSIKAILYCSKTLHSHSNTFQTCRSIAVSDFFKFKSFTTFQICGPTNMLFFIFDSLILENLLQRNANPLELLFPNPLTKFFINPSFI